MEIPPKDCYECDPDGDVILPIRNPDTPFAVWDDTTDHAAPKYDFVPSKDLPAFLGFQLGSVNIVPASATEPVSSSIGSETTSESAEDDSSDENQRTIVQIRVSSRHLILASPHFKRMLKGDWKESKTLQTHGCLCMEISDWDIGAVKILMDVIHGRTRKVPQIIDLEMLAKIAVLVDYYELSVEVIEIFSTMWITHLTSTMPKTYSRDLMLWVCISWVLKQAELLQKVTKVAIMYTTGPVQTMKLPIPERIVLFIEQRRQDCIEHTIEALHSLAIDLRKANDSCTFACSCMRLGALIKQMNDRHLYSPRPEAPFVGFSVTSLNESIRGIDTPNWRSYEYGNGRHDCSANLGRTIKATIIRETQAPELEQFEE